MTSPPLSRGRLLVLGLAAQVLKASCRGLYVCSVFLNYLPVTDAGELLPDLPVIAPHRTVA
ncbi:hypothetical protein [Streptomyces sp. NPDC005209]|uniref:hypothetical protein n=1 Tax=Streptomyces sp. NPDC005209 TaxID=3156715 RepID=UPI0033A70B91